VTGTVAIDPDGSVHAPGDGYAQAVRCLDLIEAAMAKLGAETRHVVRTRMFVTDIGLWEDFGRAHQERFGEHPPCATMVGIAALMDPDMLIEIEVDAVVID